MPTELQKMKMSDSDMTVAEFIASRPRQSAQYLIAAVSDCLRRRCRLNQAEMQIAARAVSAEVDERRETIDANGDQKT